MLQNNIYLLCILIPIIIHIGFFSGIQPGLCDFRNHIIFQNRSVHRSIFQHFRAAPSGKMTYKACIVEIQLWRLNKPFQQIIGIRMQIKDNAQCFQNLQPVLRLFLIDIRILGDFRYIQHPGTPCCCRRHKPQEFQRIYCV